MNEAGETALDIARKKQHKECESLVRSREGEGVPDPFSLHWAPGLLSHKGFVFGSWSRLRPGPSPSPCTWTTPGEFPQNLALTVRRMRKRRCVLASRVSRQPKGRVRWALM